MAPLTETNGGVDVQVLRKDFPLLAQEVNGHPVASAFPFSKMP